MLSQFLIVLVLIGFFFLLLNWIVGKFFKKKEIDTYEDIVNSKKEKVKNTEKYIRTLEEDIDLTKSLKGKEGKIGKLKKKLDKLD